MDILRVTADDHVRLATLADLASNIWNEHYVRIIGQEQVDYMLDKFQSGQAIREQIGAGYEYYLAVEDGTAVGYLGLLPHEPPGKMLLSKIYVSRGYQGTGFGTALLWFAIDLGVQGGAKVLWLTVNRHNARSIEWYRKKGFKTVGAVKKPIGNGFFMDDYVLELPLKPLQELPSRDQNPVSSG